MLILDPGEEAFSTITGFAVREGVSAASLTALGAFSGATVGRFDLDSKNYRKIPVAQQCEMLSGIGDIAIGDDGKPSLHIHVVLGLSDGSTRGGHLLDGLVQPTQRVTFEDSIYCFARTEFFSVLLGGYSGGIERSPVPGQEFDDAPCRRSAMREPPSR